MMNKTKKAIFDDIYDESKKVCEAYIDIIFNNKSKYKKLADKSLYSLVQHKTFTARFMQDLCKKALDVLSSNITKLNKRKCRLKYLTEELKDYEKNSESYEKCAKYIEIVHNRIKALERKKPELLNYSLDLSAKFITFGNQKHEKDKIEDEEKLAKHNFWITVTTLTKNFKVSIPYRPTKHTKKLESLGYVRSKFIQYKKDSIKVVYSKQVNDVENGSVIGCDTGIKKLCVFSNNTVVDYLYDDIYSFDDILTNLANTRYNTKKFKRLATFRTNYVNWSINKCFDLKLTNIATVKLEDLNMSGTSKHYKTKHWNCGEIKNKLESACKERGIKVLFVDPRNTSRQCHSCKHIDKLSRNKEQFICVKCKFKCDADLNASLNIRDKKEKRV